DTSSKAMLAIYGVGFDWSDMVTNDTTRGTKSGEEIFKKFANNSGIIGGERFRCNPLRQVIDGHEYVLVPS
ncbi:hypothetical protein Tco_0638692, partial [Tanacetum coccineum]